MPFAGRAPLHMSQLVCPSPVGEHGWFSFGQTLRHQSLCGKHVHLPDESGEQSGGRTAGVRVTCQKLPAVPEWPATLMPPSARVTSPLLSLCQLWLCKFSSSDKCVMLRPCGFVCICLMITDAKQLIMCYRPFIYFFLIKRVCALPVF